MSLHYKKSQRFLVAYLAILLLTLAWSYMIPEENLFNQAVATAEEIENARWAYQKLHKAAKEGRPDQVEGVQVNGEWSFEYKGKELEIEAPDLGHSIMVERKKVDDGIIEAIGYVTPTIADQMNFTNRMGTPELRLKFNKLRIKPAGPYEAKVLKFHRAFPITQFLGDVKEQQRGGDGFISTEGQQMIYLRIPKSLQIDAKVYIQMVGAE